MHSKRTDPDTIQADWSEASSHEPSEAEIKRVALLALEGHLTSVNFMNIKAINITDIPKDQMEKLTSIVTQRVDIDYMAHADQLGSTLSSATCSDLWLNNMELTETETQALVTAMRDRVQRVRLGYNVTLDIEELTKYDGQGRCSHIQVHGDTRNMYKKRLKRWTAFKRWKVTEDGA